jgi:putative ABC transport system ATP-binding protein
MPKLISLKKVNKYYKRSSETIHALKDVDFDLEQGDSAVIIGPSGSGKSTLLQIVAGLDTQSNGSVMINDKELSKMNDTQISSFRNSDIGFVFQFFNLQNYFTALENVSLPGIIQGRSKSETHEEALKLLKKVGLGHKANKYPFELSGGEMQRVAIARSLINKPKLILADEPTGNLDNENANNILELLSELEKDGVSVLIITHDPRASKIFKRTITISDGKLS